MGEIEAEADDEMLCVIVIWILFFFLSFVVFSLGRRWVVNSCRDAAVNLGANCDWA